MVSGAASSAAKRVVSLKIEVDQILTDVDFKICVHQWNLWVVY